MFKMLIIITIVGLFLPGCSGKDAASEIINQVPPPPPGTDTAAGTENDALKAQPLPEKTPAIDQGATYYGRIPLTLGEEMPLSFGDDTAEKVVDLEWMSTDDIRISLEQFFYASIGECADSDWQMLWMEIDSDGNILVQEDVGMFQTFTAEALGSYLLRVTFTETAGCSSIGGSAKFIDADKGE